MAVAVANTRSGLMPMRLAVTASSDAKYDHKLASYRLNNAAGSLIYSMRVDFPNQWQAEDPEWADTEVNQEVLR